MKTFDTLYARNSNGSINEWSIRVENIVSSTVSNMVISEGLIDGTKTETNKIVKTGKNIGKMNETSTYQQACNEAESRWEKKKKQGYKSVMDLATNEDIMMLEEVPLNQVGLQAWLEANLPKERTDHNNNLKPMKAQPYFRVKTVKGEKIKTTEPLIKFPCIGQPKLNGFRCVARLEDYTYGKGGMFEETRKKVMFRSKEGLAYEVLDHIADEFSSSVFKHNINGKEIELVFDGEMYIEGKYLQEISSAVRKRNQNTPLLKFHIFDLAIPDLRQDERLQILTNLQGLLTLNNIKNICLVPSIIIPDDETAQKVTDDWIKAGYEGGIFRDKAATYKFGQRPQTMTKLKRSQDKEFPILDVIGGDNAPDLGIFVCRAENGLTFNCTPEGTHEIKKEYLSNKANYIGKKLTVRFFERTEDGKPFHGVGVAVRDYE